MSKIYDALQHLEAQRRTMVSGEAPQPSANPLDPPPHEPTVRATSGLLEQTAGVSRFGAELHRRMGEAGLDGLQGLFALADQLNRALATVSHPEIDRMEADLDRVAQQVRGMQGELRNLKAVKSDLEGTTKL